MSTDHRHDDEQEAPWWAFPPVAAVALYGVSTATFLFDVDPAWVALVGGAAAAGLTYSAKQSILEPNVRSKAVAFTGGTAGFAAAWATWATAVGPWEQGPLVGILAGLGAALPLYGALRTERLIELEEVVVQQESIIKKQREERLVAQVEEEQRFEHELLRFFAEANVKGLELQEEILTPAGYTLRLHITDNTLLSAITPKLPKVEQIAARAYAARGAVLPAGAISVEKQKKAAAYEFLVHVREQNVLGKTHPLKVDDYTPLSCLDSYDIGMFEDGTLIIVDDTAQMEWLVGKTGAGKDGLLRVKTHRWARQVDQVLWGAADSKFWPTFGPWTREWALGNARKPVFDYLANTDEEIDRMFYLALLAIDVRQGIYREGDNLEISRDMPAIRMVLNEIASLMASKRKITTHRGDKLNRSEALYEIQRTGRSEGVWVTKAGQRGTGGELGVKGTSIKTNDGNRYLLGPTNPGEASYVLGRLKGVDIELLEDSGNVYANLKGVIRPMAGRVWRITTEEVPDFAAAVADLRPDMDERTANGMGSDYLDRWSDVTRSGYILDYFAQVGGTRGDSLPGVVITPRAPEHDTPEPAAAKPKEPAASDADGVFGAAPDLAAKMREALRKRGISVGDGAAKKPEAPTAPAPVADDFDAIVGQFGKELEKTAEFTAPREVPALLRKLLQEFGDREFVSTADLAAAVGMDSAELGMTLSKPPYSIKREKDGVRRPEYGGNVTRGYFMTNLKTVAQEFLRGERPAE